MFGMTNTTGRRQAASKWHGWLGRLASAADTYATYRMRHAVPEFELRRAKREISRLRRQMGHVTAH